MVVAPGANPFAKEMAIRKRIASIFNKRQEDFPSLTEYNDYLEEVEDMSRRITQQHWLQGKGQPAQADSDVVRRSHALLFLVLAANKYMCIAHSNLS
ncbi:CDK-activating kinase assembly factor MAT1 [Camellia lanceoleosa]|uniref:CDK-activating kinase assembly factor MAT1 n=1 Tax=Camellia lanceoleosa TaxID=1840588 RepID=A0ACC0IKZ2_9ERIC|nr:CDK-activating kinase assembly factor MAT1 [Camellia lanceoleosa]